LGGVYVDWESGLNRLKTFFGAKVRKRLLSFL
jgi:hypothetical protein